jgi:hypothetical protein
VLRRFGVFLLATGSLLVAWGVASAATPQRATFRVALTGTLTKDWTVTRTVEGQAGECDEITTHTGRWRLVVASSRPSRLVVIGPSGRGRPLRLSSAGVRSIDGRATQTGSKRLELRGPRCTGSIQRSQCATQRRAFRGATARLTSPVRGTARFARLQGAAPARSFGRICPEEPAEIRAIRTDLSLADAPLSAAEVFGRNVPRFFISGNTELVTTLEGDYDGRITERVQWKLTFTRVR